MSYTIQYLESEMAAQGLEVIVLVNCLVQDAIRLGASDLHIEPWENAIAVRARVNGVLTEVVRLPLDLLDKISMRFKVMANLVTYQAGMPQDGAAVGGPEVDNVQLRVSIFPTVRGEKIVIRLFDPRDRRFDLNTLGFEETTHQGLLRLLERSSGLLLFTGPTGSGKTSTMYSSLCHIIQREGSSVSISTVEDPVEFNLPMVSQTQINPAQEFTYAVALRSIMRQDPQVIMVGEIRDPETAGIAVQAGLTGHLVISTIHAGVSAGAFTRLINMEIEPFMLASSILGVMGLRLLRRNCPNCSQPYEPTPSQLKLVPESLLPQAQFRRGPGCDQCNQTGYSGRVPVSELLVVSGAFPRGGPQEDADLRPGGNRHRSKACAHFGRMVSSAPLRVKPRSKKPSAWWRRVWPDLAPPRLAAAALFRPSGLGAVEEGQLDGLAPTVQERFLLLFRLAADGHARWLHSGQSFMGFPPRRRSQCTQASHSTSRQGCIGMSRATWDGGGKSSEPSDNTTGGAGRGKSNLGMAISKSADSTSSSISPRCNVCPADSLASLTRWPLMNVPLVEAQSRTTTPSGVSMISQCWADTVGCSI